MQLSSACEKYLRHCETTKQVSQLTMTAYAMDTRELTGFLSPHMSIDDIDKHKIISYIEYLRNDRQLKPASLKRRIAFFKGMMKWLEREEMLQDDPFRKLDATIKLPKRLPKGLTAHEIKKLLKALLHQLQVSSRSELNKSVILSAAATTHGHAKLTTLLSIELLFTTGIRVSELCGIRPMDINIKSGSIFIHGKGDREREVYVPNGPTKLLLETYLKEISNRHHGATGPLLLTSRRTAVTPQYIRLVIRKTGEQAGLNKRITPHMFRHSAATHLLEAGIDIRYVQKLLGHQSITTTEIYTHVADKKLKRLIAQKHPIRQFLS